MEKSQKPVARKTAALLIFACIALVLLLLLATQFRLVVIAQRSMEPTLHPGTVALCVKAYSSPKPGDVILFSHDGKMVIKRVAFVAGQTVNIDADSFGSGDVVPEGFVYVLGDNPGVSVDSRDPSFGYVATEKIWGYVIIPGKNGA